MSSQPLRRPRQACPQDLVLLWEFWTAVTVDGLLGWTGNIVVGGALVAMARFVSTDRRARVLRWLVGGTGLAMRPSAWSR